ncbi:MAG TPA: dihydropteroate synthase [Chloroflexota bacterium]|nr:dihydropteroate synthase [Chloroflexota bacterium]
MLVASPSPAWTALLRAELARLGLPPEALGGAQQAAPLHDHTQHAALGTHQPPAAQHSALSPQRSLRWGGRTLALGARTLIMGVINVTDASLSGDGLGRDVDAVLARAEALVAAGADILDVGGESTRPGAGAVPAAEERARVEPAIAAIARRLDVPISVDTRKAAVAEAALAAGAGAVNDVSGLRHDRAVAVVTARAGAALILGHWAPRGGARPPRLPNPGASGLAVRPHPNPLPGGEGEGPLSPWERAGGEGSAVAEALRGLQESVGWALAAGCAPEQLAIDPGLGFGKAPRVSLALLRQLGALRALGWPLVVGPSRKGFIGHVLGPAEQHGWEGTAAAVALAIAGGADIVRVHDVARLARVVRMADAIARVLSDE